MTKKINTFEQARLQYEVLQVAGNRVLKKKTSESCDELKDIMDRMHEIVLRSMLSDTMSITEIFEWQLYCHRYIEFTQKADPILLHNLIQGEEK